MMDSAASIDQDVRVTHGPGREWVHFAPLTKLRTVSLPNRWMGITLKV